MSEFNCETCGKIYKTKGSLTKHINSKVCQPASTKYDLIIDVIYNLDKQATKKNLLESNAKMLEDDGIFVVFVSVWCLYPINNIINSLKFEKHLFMWKTNRKVLYGLMFTNKEMPHLYFESASMNDFIDEMQEKYALNTVLNNTPKRDNITFEFMEFMRDTGCLPYLNEMEDILMQVFSHKEKSNSDKSSHKSSNSDKSIETKSDKSIETKSDKSEKKSDKSEKKSNEITDLNESDTSSIDDEYLQKITIKNDDD